MKLTYLGHSCLQVDVEAREQAVRLVIDPGVFSTGLPESADAVLLTHAHADHVAPAAIAALAHAGARVIGDAAALQVLRESDAFDAPTELEVIAGGDTWDIEGISVVGVGALHAVIHADLPRETNVGFLVDDGTTTLFHPGDTYEYTPSGVDVLAVPVVSPWGAAKEAVDFVRAVGPDQVIPIHDKLLVEGARGLFLGLIANLGGAPLYDIATQGPLEL